MGSIYKRGEIYWIKYYRNGKPYRESSHSDMITKAQKLLKKREGEIADGKLPGVYFDKVTFDELAEDVLHDYQIEERDTINKAKRSIRYLKEYFGNMKAVDITTATVSGYIVKRKERGLSNASINRELAILKKMFHLAAQGTPPKVSMIPYFKMLPEKNVRKGFFEYDEYVAVRDNADEDFRPVVIFGYHTGCRISEILNLPLDKVDPIQGIARLEDTKNETDREICFNGISELREAVENRFKDKMNGCPWMFHRKDGKKFTMDAYRAAWFRACIKSGFYKEVVYENEKKVKVPTKLFHDFRRTAIRNMVRSGISESVAMQISGHKTRSVFERYNITSGRDLKEASKKMGAYHERQSNQGVVIQFHIKQAQNE